MNKLTSWESLTGTKPTIESKHTIATVTFPLKSAIQRITDPGNTDVAKNVAKKLSERQRQIIALICENPQTTRAEIATAIGVSAKTIERELAVLSNIVRYIGSKKGGHWEISDNGLI